MKRLIQNHLEDIAAGRLRLIADSLQADLTEVRRGVKNKYLQYPSGTVLLKSLFTSGIAREERDEISSASIPSMIADIVRSENKKKPCSDSKIAELLQRQGIQISRRTVAKYRLLAAQDAGTKRAVTKGAFAPFMTAFNTGRKISFHFPPPESLHCPPTLPV